MSLKTIRPTVVRIRPLDFRGRSLLVLHLRDHLLEELVPVRFLELVRAAVLRVVALDPRLLGEIRLGRDEAAGRELRIARVRHLDVPLREPDSNLRMQPELPFRERLE